MIRNITAGFETVVTVTAVDGEDLSSYRISRDIIISTKKSISPLMAGIISGCLVFALAVIIVMAKVVFQRKNYKFDYSSIQRTNRDDMVRSASDYGVIKPDDSSCTDMSHTVLIKGGSGLGMGLGKNCSDSGRGDSGEDDNSNHDSSIMVINEKSSNHYYGSKYCTQDCYRLGHSDTCWLPTEYVID